jgi:hypothetical protein
LPGLEGLSEETVAEYWLSDEHARGHLNDQLAELLRVLLERRLDRPHAQFSFCPTCGGALKDCQQDDVWVKGLACSTGHTWAERGGHLGGRIGQQYLVLHSEPSAETVVSLAQAWLKGNPLLDVQLHKSLQPVLSAVSRLARSDA